MGGHGGYMGWWGHLGSPPQKGITQYAVSSYAQKPFAGLSHAPYNFVRRFSVTFAYLALPAYSLYYIISRAKQYNHWLYTKAGRETLERLG